MKDNMPFRPFFILHPSSFIVHRACHGLHLVCVSLCFAAEVVAAGPAADLTGAPLDTGRRAALDKAQMLNDAFLADRAAGKYREALEAARKSLEIRKKLLGEKHFDTLVSLNNVGMGLWDTGDRASATTYLRHSLRLRRELLGEKHRATALALANLGDLLMDLGQYVEAKKCLTRALVLRQELQGEKHEDSLATINQLGLLLKNMGELEAGRPFLEKSLVLRKEVFGEKHVETALALHNLAGLLDAMDHDLAARSYYEQALVIRQELLGENHYNTLVTLNNLGSLLKQMGDHAAARSSLERSLILRKEEFGEQNAETALAMNNLATLLDDLGEYEAAQPCYEQALAIRREVLGNRHVDTALSMANLAYFYGELGRHSESKALYEEALAVRKGLLGENHPTTTSTRNALRQLEQTPSDSNGNDHVDVRRRALLAEAVRLHDRSLAHHRAGRYRDAFDSVQRAYGIRKELLGESDPGTLSTLNNLGMAYAHLGDHAAAVPLLRELLRLRRQLHGEQHVDTALAYFNLAQALSGQGQYEESKAYVEQALSIRGQLLGEKHRDYLNALNDLGVLHNRMGDYSAARRCFERSLALRKEVFGEKHLEVALALSNLATLLDDLGDYAAARPLCEQALAIRQELLGAQHPDVAASLSNLGLLLQSMGNDREARTCFEEALAIDRKILGDEHPDTANRLNNLGYLLANTGDAKGAIDYYQQALAIWTKTLGEAHPSTLNVLNNLGCEMDSIGNLSAARDYHQRVVDLRKRTLGVGHPDVATSLNNLASTLTSLGEDEAAQARYEEALAIRVHSLGDDHCHTGISYSNLAWLLECTGRGDEAIASEDRSRRAVRQHVTRVLQGLPESEQLKFLATDQGPFHTSLSLGLAERRRPKACERSAAWVLNGKAIAQETLTQRSRLLRDAREPAIAALANELLATRRQMAAAALAGPGSAKDESRQVKLDELAAHERELARKIAELSRQPIAASSWIELDDVQKRIAHDAVLIEIARFDVLDFKVRAKTSRWRPARYAAWMIPPAGRGDVQLVDLGEAAAVEAAIERIRSRLWQAVQRCREIGEQEAEREMIAELNSLAALVWRPLLPYLNGAKKVLISPDAALWLVPWAALPVSEGRYLVEDFELQYVVSGRDLLAAADDSGPRRPSLIVADPDFDLPPGDAQKELRRILPQHVELVPDGERGAMFSTSLPSVTRLPGTALEASLIAPNLQRYVHLAPDVRTDREALEAVVKLVQGPEVVVLSTHGFFLPNQKPANADGLRLENPLLRCGLLLAGCNRPHTVGQDDGILTGLEIVGLDLRGTRLAVLSACETGLGQVCNGEGVAGLRQAFLLAGAQDVVATLWQVPDRQSVQLMNAFFESLAKGNDPAEALRQAQTSLIAARRGHFEAAHPFFWAAFTVTGP